MQIQKLSAGLTALGITFLWITSFAAESTLMSKSLEELLNTPVAILTQSSKASYVPALVTTITAGQKEENSPNNR
jgi:hypothetical protein